jgi:DNA-binding PadR family transcriptional regulator
MLQSKEELANAQGLILELRKKILTTFLAVATLALLTETGVSSAPNLIAILRKRHGIPLSPGTFYPVLYKLEKREA